MTVLKSGLNPERPVAMCRTARGDVLVANGIDRAQRWDGRTSASENAGITAPATACTAIAIGAGTIWGDLTIYVQYVDDEGLVSSFGEPRTLTIASGSAAYGLSYTNVPVSSDSRVTKRRIWRNTRGQEVTWYLDVEIANNTATSAVSTRTDDQLREQTAERFYTEDGWPNAKRHTPPPSDMSVCVSYQDRSWWGVPVEYTRGSVYSASGATVTGSDTAWTQEFAGRYLRVAGGTRVKILSATAGSLTLAEDIGSGYGGSNAYYAVDSGPDRRNAIIFSEAGEPESCGGLDDQGNYINTIVLQEDGDVMTGLMPAYNHLYILKRKHIYRLSTSGDPRREGCQASLVAGRGCVNQRCWCRVENVYFLMDRDGAYIFDGSGVESISDPIQDYWRGKILWGNERWFHAAHNAAEQTVKFFVCLDGSPFPRHVLCYNYRLKQWHEDEYEYHLGASGLCPIAGEYRVVVGADDRPMLLDEGVLDGPAPYAHRRLEKLADWPDGTITGTVDSASLFTLTDADASFTYTSWFSNPGVVGAPITVIDSDGNRQTNRIVSVNNSTKVISVLRPWDKLPQAGDSYVVGGIHWQVKLGSYRFLEAEESNVRAWRLFYKTLAEPTTANVRLYLNGSETPLVVNVGNSQYDQDQGVTMTRDSANAQVDLTHETLEGNPLGYAQARLDDGFEMGSPAHRWVDIELEGTQGRERVKLYALALDGVYAKEGR